MAAVAREPSSGLSSPGPDSDIEHLGSRPVTGHENGTPLRSIAPGSDSKKNKESPSPENDDDRPSKKKRIRRTRAELDEDRENAKKFPHLYYGNKNPKPINPNVRTPLGETGYTANVNANATPTRIAQLSRTEGAGSPPIVMSPYAATLAPEPPRQTLPLSSQPEATPSRNGPRESLHNSPRAPADHSHPTILSQPTNPSPRTTHYDPIRGFSSTEATRPNLLSTTASPQLKMAMTTVTTNRASASPAISSLIDPPEQAQQQVRALARPLYAPSNSTHNISDTIIVSSSHPHASAANAEYPARTASVPAVEPHRQVQQHTTLMPRDQAVDTAMDIDAGALGPKPHSSRASISSGASPHTGPIKAKEKREKPPLPPLPGSGSGLLTSAMLGVPAGSSAASVAGDEPKPAPVIEISIKLESSGNNIFHFNRLAEEKYGFNALHPRLAAQKERLARVAAAGAMLEHEARARAKGMDPGAMLISSDDDDNTDDEEKNAESNAETAGANGNEPPKRKKRNFKEDNYDKGDPFVDDSELGLEEQAALATDGFFVFCGPIIDQERMPTIQGRPDGTAAPTGRGRGRGRGRGGGPGSRGGKVPGVEGSGTGRGGGPGSRGGRGRGRGRGRGANSAAAVSAASTGNKDNTAQPTANSNTAGLASFLSTFDTKDTSHITPVRISAPPPAQLSTFQSAANGTMASPLTVD